MHALLHDLPDDPSACGDRRIGIAFDALDPITRLRVECFCHAREPLLYDEA